MLIAAGYESYQLNPTLEELKEEVIRLEKSLGHLPTYYDICKQSKYSQYHFANKIGGTYVKALHAMDFDYISQSQWKNQKPTKGIDNIYYRSKFEASIAAILFNFKSLNKIISYEYEKKICLDRAWTCDFYIKIENKEIWLELDGIGEKRGDPYNSGKNEKIEYYKINNMNYKILSYSKHKIEEKLKDLLFS